MAVIVECERCGRYLDARADAGDGQPLVCPACRHVQERRPTGPEPVPAELPRILRRDLEPHRGTLILVLGILSLVLMSFLPPVGIVLGVIAWIMGRSDLAKIRAGLMDPEGERQTYAGFVSGKVGAILASIMTVLFCGFYAAFFAIMINFGPPGGPAPKTPPAANIAPPPGEPGEEPKQPEEVPDQSKEPILEKSEPQAKPDSDKPSPDPMPMPKD